MAEHKAYKKAYDEYVNNFKDTPNAKLEALKTEYFWQQKIHEVVHIILWLCAWGLLFIISLKLNYSAYLTSAGSKGDYYLISGFVAFLILFLIVLIYHLIKWWIQSNWEEAEDRAREELGMEGSKWKGACGNGA